MRWESCLGTQSAGVLRAVFDGLISYLILSYQASVWNLRPAPGRRESAERRRGGPGGWPCDHSPLVTVLVPRCRMFGQVGKTVMSVHRVRRREVAYPSDTPCRCGVVSCTLCSLYDRNRHDPLIEIQHPMHTGRSRMCATAGIPMHFLF